MPSVRVDSRIVAYNALALKCLAEVDRRGNFTTVT